MLAGDSTMHGSSPRPWRCFPAYQQPHIMNLVFSTPVEVFLAEVVPTMALGRLLHARGGVSDQFVLNLGAVLSSPRPWRCFSITSRKIRSGSVFSTPVEVFLYLRPVSPWGVSLLHARGGVSFYCGPVCWVYWSSPRPWRCFSTHHHPPCQGRVFSTPVEVFPAMEVRCEQVPGLLHARTLHTRTLSHSTPLSPSHHTLCFLLAPGINF